MLRETKTFDKRSTGSKCKLTDAMQGILQGQTNPVHVEFALVWYLQGLI